MYKKILVLVVLSVFLAGCVSNAEQQVQQTAQPDAVVREIDDKGYYAHTYKMKGGVSNHTADSNKNWLVLYLVIGNSNCEELRASKYMFSVVVDNVEYDPTVFYGDNELQMVTLQKGGRAEGYICFEVPKKDEIDYTLLMDKQYGCNVVFK